MPRAVWKGAISFGLVHVPVALYPASQESEIDFDWLDKRSMDPVGYKRVNKRTGKEIDKDDIVRGVKQASGDYVVLADDEVKAAYPRSTQTIEIEAFVAASEIPLAQLERPYFLEPVGKADKVYALLREAMREADVTGIARVVMRTKQHLAALLATESMLLLNTLRWADEMRAPHEPGIPAPGRSAQKLKDSELKMASQLVRSMTTAWDPRHYADTFSDAIHRLIERKVRAGETEQVEPFEAAPGASAESNVVDLSELLKRSLAPRKEGRRADAARAEHKRAAAKRPARKRA